MPGGARIPSGVAAGFEQRLRQAVHSGGEALPVPARSFMEHRFGSDFSAVRVHRGAQADALARSVTARAFTYGQDLFFARSQYQPERPEGQRLLAHELAHTLQQGRGGSKVQRAVTDFGVKENQEISVVNVTSASKESYWGKKLEAHYELMLEHMEGVSVQEQNEILGGVAAKLPDKPPAVGADKTTQLVQVPAGTPPVNHAVFVKVVPRPKEETDAAARPQLYVDWLGRGGQLAPEEVGSVPSDGDDSSPAVDSTGLRNQPDDFLTAYREERKRLNYWFNTRADTSAGFVKTLKMTTTVKEGEAQKERTSLFVVRYTRSDLDGTALEYFFQGSDTLPTSAPPPVTAAKTGPSVEIEALQSDPRDKMGTVDLSGVPDAERASVEYTLVRYFEDSKARSTEVDAVIPISDTGTWVNYTLVFDTSATGGVHTTHVKAVRIGSGQEPTTETQAAALDVRTVKEFPATETDPAKLAAWITARYKGITLTKTTLTEIVDEANAQMKRDAKTPAWFETNYGITILSATDCADRLEKQHAVPKASITGTKDFEPEELTHLELALQQFGATMLAKWTGVHAGRQQTSSTAGSDTAGQMYRNGSDYTMVLHDRAFGKDVTFVGGPGQVFPVSVSDIIHELGHVAEYKETEAKAKFYAFVKAEGIKPFTWYAQEKKTEFFAEAFSLYYADPEWMKTNHPKLHVWFKTYDEKGAPPP